MSEPARTEHDDHGAGRRPVRRVHVVVNPISGRRRSRAGARVFIERLKSTLDDVVITQTRGSGDAALAAERACREKADALVVVGGDGTLREAAGGMNGTGVPILIVPCGTENVVGKYLGLAIEDDLLFDVLMRGRRLPFDLVQCNDRPFLFVSGVGYDADVVRLLSARRKGHISYLTYIRPLLSSLLNHRAPRMRIDVDDQRVFEGYGQAIAGSIPRYAFGMKILGRAAPNDGLLDLCVFEYRNKAGLLWHALHVLADQHLGSPGVYYWQGRRIRIECDSAHPVELDGDPAGATPIELSLVGRRIEFLVSANSRLPDETKNSHAAPHHARQH